MRRSIAIWVLTFLWVVEFGGGIAGQSANTGAPAKAPETAVKLPLKKDSVRFAFIGDMGNASKAQYQIGEQMVKFREATGFDFVLMLGDNLYGGKSPKDFRNKFEEPYRRLTDAGVKFYAAIGNHDISSEIFYQPFNMGGKRYYVFKKGDAEFFALDSNYMDPEQMKWLDKELSSSNSRWKICYFHHPFYSHAKKHGSDVDLRQHLEPLFMKYGVDVVLNGHDHVYERIKPKNGIYYFVLGNSGELRPHDLRPSEDTIKGFDTDNSFGLMEIAGDELHFQVVSRIGETVDSGVLTKAAVRRTSGP